MKLKDNINQLNSDVQGIKASIVDKGVEIPDGTPLSEYGDKITEVYKTGRDSAVDKSKIIEKTASGEYIALDDVSEVPHDINVVLTSGSKNLLNQSGITTGTQTGMTLEYLEDEDCFLLNGTSTASDAKCLTYINIQGVKNFMYGLSVTYISGEANIPSGSAVFYLSRSGYEGTGNSNWFCANLRTYDTTISKVLDGNMIDRCWLYITPDITFTNYKFRVQLEQVSGENLFDISSPEIEKKRRLGANSGTSWSNSADGSDNFNVSHYIPVDSGKKYTFVNTNTTSTWYCWYDKDKVFIKGSGAISGTILTAPENSCYFRFDYPATDTDVTFHELHEPSEYEPYKETLTDYSGVSLTRCGWNLVTFRQWTTNLSGVSMVKNDDGTIIANGKATSLRQLMSYQIPIIPNEKKISYSISDVSQSGIQGHIEFRDENNNTIQNRYFTLAETKEIPEGCTNIILNIYVIEGTTVENFVFKPMVNFGSTPLPYEPYNGQTLTANPDGTVEGITSQSPYMYMTTDNENVTINATYHKSYGMQTEYDRFWDSYQQNGQRWNYSSCFTGTAWNDETLRPKYDIKPKWDGAAGMFRLLEFNGNLKEHFASLGITCDFSEVLSASQLFYSAQYITEIPDLDMSSLNATGGTYLLYGCTNLKSAQIIFGEQATDLSSAFYGSSSLENLIIGGKIGATVDIQWSTKLTKESILSIFNALSATKSGLTLTLSTTAVTNAFGSIESTEWINLRASKSNWTISLV